MSAAFTNIDQAIAVLAVPLGREGDQSARQRALQFLLTHASEAYPRVLATLDPEGRSAAPQFVVLALPAFARADSVPPLASILNNADQPDAAVAARALADHPATAARDALLHALKSNREITVGAAADGLLFRGDPAVCGELIGFINHRNREIRYHILQAAAGLGCIDDKALSTLSEREPDEQLRQLATRLLKERRTTRQ